MYQNTLVTWIIIWATHAVKYSSETSTIMRILHPVWGKDTTSLQQSAWQKQATYHTYTESGRHDIGSFIEQISNTNAHFF